MKRWVRAHNCSPPSLNRLFSLAFCCLTHIGQWIPNEPLGNQLAKQNLVCPDSLLLKYEVNFPKGAQVSVLPVPVTRQVGPGLHCAGKLVMSARPKQRDDSLALRTTGLQALLHAERKVQWCREGATYSASWSLPGNYHIRFILPNGSDRGWAVPARRGKEWLPTGTTQWPLLCTSDFPAHPKQSDSHRRPGSSGRTG